MDFANFSQSLTPVLSWGHRAPADVEQSSDAWTGMALPSLHALMLSSNPAHNQIPNST